MKKITFLTLFLLFAMLLLPLIKAAVPQNKTVPTFKSDNILQEQEIPANTAYSETFRLLCEDGKIVELSAEEYITGVVAAEMPALYHNEALKAQAVAAYTFACRRKQSNKNQDYDITCDPTVDQAYISNEKLQEKWGEKTEEYRNKIHTAVKETAGLMVTYDGNAALTVYHAVSSGRTESAEDIWGGAVPYLVPVDSSGDRLADNYLTTVELSSDDFSSKLSALCKFSGNASEWIGKTVCTDSGTVKSITVCGSKLNGSDVREALDLRSSNFEIIYKDNSFCITTRGYGHGVGLSQHGANIMANDGSSFEEILCWYYPGCAVEKIKS